MQILRNFLPSDTLDKVHQILKQERWGFGYISNDTTKPIWNFDKGCSKQIGDLMMPYLPEYKLEDYHINGQTFQLTGSPHQDNGCTHALVWFPYGWDFTWGGRLNIIDNQIKIITPDKNLGVLFDSSLYHYAEAPVVPVLRVSVGLKLTRK